MFQIQAIASDKDSAAIANPESNLILPPPDIRQVIDKTADFVARNGPAFEERVKESGQNSQKFAFLNPYDPYHRYYEEKIVVFKKRHQENFKAGQLSTETLAHPATIADDQINDTSAPGAPTKPNDLIFSYPVPPVSAVDFEIIQLTAQYTAVLGRNFANELAFHEANNFQFHFLKPNHGLYDLYTRLVDQYCLVLSPPAIIKERISSISQDKFNILDISKKRAEWMRYKQSIDRKKKEQVNKEALQYAQIDWHDFVIVEAVEFTAADEQAQLPFPTSLADLQHASIEQKSLLSTFSDANYAIEEAPPDFVPENIPQREPTEEERAAIELQQQEEKKRQAMLQAQQPNHANVKSEYVSRVAVKARNNIKQICPRCNKAIPSDELEEHLRIEMLDPKWKDQKRIEEERRATSNLSSADVAENIKRLAKARTDIFDTMAQPDEKKKRISK